MATKKKKSSKKKTASKKQNSDALTSKQEKFCQEVIKGASASEAYRLSYDTENMKPATINRAAKQLMDNYKITTRLAELRKPVIEEAQFDLAAAMKQADEDRAVAFGLENPSAMVSSTTLKCKLAGHLVDKKEITVRKVDEMEDEDELLAYIYELEHRLSALDDPVRH